MVCGIGNVYVSAVLKQVVIGGATLYDFVVMHNRSKVHTGRKVCCYDCLVMVALCNRADHYIFAL